MKKILLALMMMISASFATDPVYWTFDGIKSTSLITVEVGKCYYDSLNDKYLYIRSVQTGSGRSDLSSGEYFLTGTTFSHHVITGSYVASQGGYLINYSDYLYTGYYPSQKYRESACNNVNPTPTCTADQDLVAGVCVPKCPDGQTVGADGICAGTCTTGSHWDYNATIPSCVGDIKYGEKLQHDSGAFHVLYEDGALMYCRTDGKCLTTDSSGEVIPNRYYAGGIPEAPNVYSDLLNDALTLTGNLVGKTLQIAGYTIGVSSSGFGILLSEDNPVAGAINPGVLAGASLVSLGNLLVTNNEKIITTPTDSGNAVKVYFNDSSTNNASISDSAPADGSKATVPNSNGATVQKLYSEETLKEYQSHWAGQGELGATVLSATDQVYLSIMETNKQIKAIQKTSETTATVTEINKSDIANTVANGTDLPYTQKQVTQTINNDGTVKTTETTTPSTVSPKNNNNTSTNPTTGQTTTTPSSALSGTANTSDGKSIDLSGVTSRLDGLGKQLTKLNETATTGNGLLGDIKSNTASASSSLNSIQGSVNAIKNDIERTDISSIPHNIPKDTSGGDWNTWKATWDNVKSSLDSVKDQTDSFKSLFENGFSLDLTGGTVTQCPYSSTVDFGFFTFPLSIDVCAFSSSFRSVFYALFYLFFVRDIFIFSFKMFMRMV